MELTTDQVRALAPDASAASAGEKLGETRHWQGLGRGEAALWGECQGSALYRTRVALPDLATKCSCPSRKFPCKHALGLLFLAAASPAALLLETPPVWVADWLSGRAATAEGRAKPSESAPTDAADAAPRKARGGRADRREELVRGGLEALDLWLADLVRNGLASAEAQPATYWERQAARMVDAQAPGVAARLRSLAAIPHATPDWPRRLLHALGRLALLSEAYGHLDALDPELREDVRAAVGWTLTREEVLERGETVRDEWWCLGRHMEDDGKVRTRFTHLLGAGSGRYALVLHFSAAGRPWEEGAPVPGARQEAELAYWPGAARQRALVRSALSAPAPITGPVPSAGTLGEYLSGVAAASARQPWIDRFGCALSGVTPVRAADGDWWVRDHEGCAVRLRGGEHWTLLALGGGWPLDLGGEWDGEALLPLGALTDGAYHVFGEEA